MRIILSAIQRYLCNPFGVALAVLTLSNVSHSVQVTDFVDAEDPVRVLSDAHVFEFGPECKVYHEHRGTNEEIKHLCSGMFIKGNLFDLSARVHSL